jgi:spore coat protein H
VINNSSDSEFPAELEAVFNVDTFLRYLAVVLSDCNLDTYLYMSQNYYLYNNPSTGKFEWIPWDQNESWGLFGSQAANQDHPLFERAANIGMGSGQPAPLFTRVMDVEQYRQDYAAYVDLLRRTYFHHDVIRPRASALHDLLKPHVVQGDKMEYPVSAFDTNWDTDYTPSGPGFAAFGIAHFTQLRNDYVDAHLLADL